MALLKLWLKWANTAYKLKLFKRLKVHPTFHVSFLKKFYDVAEYSKSQAKRAPLVMRKQFDDQIEKILDHRILGQNKKNRRTKFLIQWKDKLIVEITWERNTTL